MSVAGTVKDELAGPPSGPAPRKSRGETHPLVVIGLSFVTAIIVGGILIAVTNQPTRNALRHFSASPGKVFSAAWHAVSAAYVALFEGGDLRPAHVRARQLSGTTSVRCRNPLYNATPLILVGLSVGLAFRTGLFNIGAQGQLILGAMTAGYIGFTWHLPPVIHLVVALVAGLHCGRGVGWCRRVAQSAHRRARSHHHDHDELHRARPARLRVEDQRVSASGQQSSNLARSCTDRPASESCCRHRCGSTSAC